MPKEDAGAEDVKGGTERGTVRFFAAFRVTGGREPLRDGPTREVEGVDGRGVEFGGGF